MKSTFRLVSIMLLVLLAGCDRAGTDGASDSGKGSRGGGENVAEGNWRRLSSAGLKRTEVAAAAAGNRIFVAGGFVEGGESVLDVEVFDTRSGKFSKGPPLPIAVNHAMAASDGETVYVLGGYTAVGPTAKSYRLEADAWKEIAPLPEARGAGGAAAINGKVYVAGGVGPAGIAGDLFVYDPGTNSWSKEQGPPTPREHLGVASHSGLLYVMGGRTEQGNLAAAEAYDPAAKTWTKLPDMPTARGGIGAAVTSNGFVVVPGGEHSAATFPEVEAFDIAGGSWMSLPSLPTPRHGLGVVAIGTRVYVISGGPSPGLAFSGANEVIDLAHLTAEQ